MDKTKILIADSSEEFRTLLRDILSNEESLDVVGTAGDGIEALQKVAELEGVAESGFRVVSNCGRDGAQTVGHLHIHVLGGKQLPENMG